MIPSAARRSANGSFEPVGLMAAAKKPASASSLSASATTTLSGAVGQASSGPFGAYWSRIAAATGSGSPCARA
jgi:hypothetical protein